MKSRGRTHDFNKLSRGPPKEHPLKIGSKSVQRFERRNRQTKKAHADDDNDNNEGDGGHSVIARVTLTR